MEELIKEVFLQLEKRGVKINDMVELIRKQERKKNLSDQQYKDAILKILSKREVCHTILTAIAIDEACEKNLFPNTINQIIKQDASLYGIDEVMALSIVNVYGSIAFTNFGYLDKIKPGIIGKLDTSKKQCNTFLDDIVSAIVASAISKIAHQITTSK